MAGYDMYDLDDEKNENVSPSYWELWGTGLKLLAYNLSHQYPKAQKFPPDPPLVGVELNPGPAGRMGAASKKQQRKRATKVKVGVGVPTRPIVMREMPLSRNYSLTHSVGFANATYENRKGLRVNGRQRLADIRSGPTTSVPEWYNVAPGGGATTVNAIQVNPTLFGGDLYNIAQSFLQFNFVSIKLTYVPIVSTSYSAGITLGFNPDGGGATTVTATNIQTLEAAVETASYSLTTLDISRHLDKSRLFYNYRSSSTVAEQREDFQGLLLCNGTDCSSANTILGAVWIDYTLDLFGMGSMTGLQMNARLYHSELLRLRDEFARIQRRRREFIAQSEKVIEKAPTVETLLGDFKKLFSETDQKSEKVTPKESAKEQRRRDEPSDDEESNRQLRRDVSSPGGPLTRSLLRT